MSPFEGLRVDRLEPVERVGRRLLFLFDIFEVNTVDPSAWRYSDARARA
jgi:hypothetical protein